MNWIKTKLLLLLVIACLTVNAQEIKRVVSLAPSITEDIYLVGGKDKLVGCTSYCTQALKDSVEQIGSAIEVNIEKIFSLKPDVVLAMGLTKPQDIASMKKLGIKVEVMKTPANFEGICEQTLHIAGLIGCSDSATIVVNEAKAKVKAIKKKSAVLSARKIFFQLGANPIFTVLENTFMNDFITFCNGKNIAAGLKHGTMTRESVVVKNPDVIIVADMGGLGQKEQKEWNIFNEMSAVKNNKVFIISSETSCSPTPANFVSALEDIYGFVSE